MKWFVFAMLLLLVFGLTAAISNLIIAFAATFLLSLI